MEEAILTLRSIKYLNQMKGISSNIFTENSSNKEPLHVYNFIWQFPLDNNWNGHIVADWMSIFSNHEL